MGFHDEMADDSWGGMTEKTPRQPNSLTAKFMLKNRFFVKQNVRPLNHPSAS
jgi:hypothetical protein